MSGNLVITEVKPNSVAANAGILVGDVIWKYNNVFIECDKTLTDLIAANWGSTKSIDLEVIRWPN